MKNYARIAEVCHEANRAYCKAIGEDVPLALVPWDESPEWQKEAVIRGVILIDLKPESTAEDLHKSWVAEMQADGWVFGNELDRTKKYHPLMVYFDELPHNQRVRDQIFLAIAGTALRQPDDYQDEKLADDDRYPITTTDSLQHG